MPNLQMRHHQSGRTSRSLRRRKSRTRIARRHADHLRGANLRRVKRALAPSRPRLPRKSRKRPATARTTTIGRTPRFSRFAPSPRFDGSDERLPSPLRDTLEHDEANAQPRHHTPRRSGTTKSKPNENSSIARRGEQGRQPAMTNSPHHYLMYKFPHTYNHDSPNPWLVRAVGLSSAICAMTKIRTDEDSDRRSVRSRVS